MPTYSTKSIVLTKKDIHFLNWHSQVMLGRTWPAAEWSITWHPKYCPHISINNQAGLQLASWRDRGNHVTDQSKEKVAHSLRWFTAQQFVPPSVWIHAVYLLYTNLSRLEICICQTSPITPAACHTWGSSQPGGGKGRKKKTECSCQHRSLSGLKRHQVSHFSGSNFFKLRIFLQVSDWVVG